MKNIKLTVAYDGTEYHGFQKQKGTELPTIQSVLEQCLFKLSKKSIEIIGAGRTDAGVHARGQVINFQCENWYVPIKKTPLALNSLLPKDIVVRKAELVPFDFHARFSAVCKTYSYIIYNAKIPDPFIVRFALHEPRKLDVEGMRTAAQHLIGKHDFNSFCAKGTSVKTTIRTLMNADINKEQEQIKLTFSADGFLYNMVRIMVGTLMQVGLGKIKHEDIKYILHIKDRRSAGPTVPPQGLFLEKVIY